MDEFKVIFEMGKYTIYKEGEKVEMSDLQSEDFLVLAMVGMTSEVLYHNDLKRELESRSKKEKLS